MPRKRWRVGGCKPGNGYVLVIAEKPKAAARIAEALGGSSAKRCRHRSGAPYWVLVFKGSRYVVGAAAGHLFGLDTDERGFPVFSYTWRPLWSIDPEASYTRPFYEALRDLSRGAALFVNACDYDIEGSVIGYMVIKWFGRLSSARRARFSSLTPGELRRAFERLSRLDMDMVEAGLARHELDWLWGVNISRALMDAVRLVSGRRVVLSAGRVQSPTLIEAMRRDLLDRLHVPLPVYHVRVSLRKDAWRRTVTLASFETRKEAEELATLLKRGEALVERVSSRREVIPRPPPFNLGDLQAEAARLFGYTPFFTQRVAEELYLEGLISYPRTNSQRLPRDLDIQGILAGLSRLPAYRSHVRLLLEMTGGRLEPRNGVKVDPAHPAIHPTGEVPRSSLGRHHARIYDLVVKRFLATLSADAVAERVEALLKFPGGVSTRLSGGRLVRRGWLLFYGEYSGVRFEEPPPLVQGERLRYSVRVVRELSKAPEPHTRASLVKWMESAGIGTEATRARIVELLFKRGYLVEERRRVRVTELGISVADVLTMFFSELASVELTRRFEEELEAIRSGRKTRGEVISEAKRLLSERLQLFKEKHMENAGRLLAAGMGLIAAGRCVICGRPIAEGGGFCKIHSMALESLRQGYREWLRREGDMDSMDAFRQFLNEVARSKRSGAAVREAAMYLLRHGGDRASF